jgi:endoglucanase
MLAGVGFTEVKAYVVNTSGWPARASERLSFRYFITLEPGVTPANITVTSGYNQCARVSGPTPWSGSVHAVTVDCTGVAIFPGGPAHYRKEVQFRIASSGAWDPTNDPSYQTIARPPGATPVTAASIALYDDGRLVFGQEPGGGPSPDANGNSTVDAIDALCVLRAVAGMAATASCPSPLPRGDVNGSGAVDAVDALCVLRYVAGLPATSACPLAPPAATAGGPAGQRAG